MTDKTRIGMETTKSKPNPETPATRFHAAFDYLCTIGRTNTAEFCRLIAFDRPSFIKRHNTSKTIRPEWLTVIVREFRINPEWLITGHGRMFSPPRPAAENDGTSNSSE